MAKKITKWRKNQDGHQTRIVISSVNFYANQLKLYIWKERLIKKIP
jgi:hypothetical protein